MSSFARRILLITGDYPPALSGIADYTQKLATHLARQGADVTVLTTQGGNGDDLTETSFKLCRSVPKGWRWGDRREVAALCAEYDVVNIQYPSLGYGRGPLINLLPRLIRRHNRRCKVVTTLHDFRVMSRKYRMRATPMLWLSDALIYVAAAELPLIRQYMLINRNLPTQYIPIAANAEPIAITPQRRAQLRRDFGVGEDEILVSFFGILYPHKGVPELVEALESLRSKGHRVRLLAIADFDRQADYVDGITRHLTKPWITWVRGARGDQVSECLHACDLACISDRFGAAANRSSMLASLAHGLPTVATIGSATPPNIRELFDLELVPANSAAALAFGMEKIISDREYAQMLTKTGPECYQKFSWSAAAEAHIAFFQLACANIQASSKTN